MAQKTLVVLTDDLDGSEADTTIRFAWSGHDYEIDLSEKNSDEFHSAIGRYVEAARRVGATPAASAARKRSTPAAAAKSASGLDTAAIRSWAKENGHQVNERGRLSAAVVEAYETAHGDA